MSDNVREDRLVSSTVVCQRLHVSPRRLSGLIRDGVIDPVRLPGSGAYRRFRSADVDRLIRGITEVKEK